MLADRSLIMDYAVFMNKILEDSKDWEDYYSIIITTNNEEYEILRGTEFMGGLEDTLMCSELGNVAYSTIESIAEDLYNYLTKRLEVIKEVEYY
jgi:hypothetical protein